MIRPLVVRGPEDRGPNEVWIYTRDALGMNPRPGIGTAGWKTAESLFIAGAVLFSLYMAITGSGTVSVNAIPMDEWDAAELPFKFSLATGQANGARHVPFGANVVAVTMKLEFVSTGTSSITAALFCRTN